MVGLVVHQDEKSISPEHSYLVLIDLNEPKASTCMPWFSIPLEVRIFCAKRLKGRYFQSIEADGTPIYFKFSLVRMAGLLKPSHYGDELALEKLKIGYTFENFRLKLVRSAFSRDALFFCSEPTPMPKMHFGDIAFFKENENSSSTVNLVMANLDKMSRISMIAGVDLGLTAADASKARRKRQTLRYLQTVIFPVQKETLHRGVV